MPRVSSARRDSSPAPQASDVRPAGHTEAPPEKICFRCTYHIGSDDLEECDGEFESNFSKRCWRCAQGNRGYCRPPEPIFITYVNDVIRARDALLAVEARNSRHEWLYNTADSRVNNFNYIKKHALPRRRCLIDE